MDTAEKPVEACVWWTEPASIVACPVHSVNSASGMAARPKRHARSACCCIQEWLGLRHFSGEIGRREYRRACLRLVRDQRVEVKLLLLSPSVKTHLTTASVALSREQRTHSRLSWETRLSCNACRDTVGQGIIKLFGSPNDFARDLDLTRRVCPDA